MWKTHRIFAAGCHSQLADIGQHELSTHSRAHCPVWGYQCGLHLSTSLHSRVRPYEWYMGIPSIWELLCLSYMYYFMGSIPSAKRRLIFNLVLYRNSYQGATPKYWVQELVSQLISQPISMGRDASSWNGCKIQFRNRTYIVYTFLPKMEILRPADSLHYLLLGYGVATRRQSLLSNSTKQMVLNGEHDVRSCKFRRAVL